MRFIEKNKHRLIEKSTMELAMSWYYRYLEKEEQIEKIEQALISFEEWMATQDDTISMGELQRAWSKSYNV